MSGMSTPPRIQLVAPGGNRISKFPGTPPTLVPGRQEKNHFVPDIELRMVHHTTDGFLSEAVRYASMICGNHKDWRENWQHTAI